ncbi:MAG: hypothetical protein V3T15_09340 [Pseudomonadales bacterium]
MKREELLIVIAQRIAQIQVAHPLRVAIDGIDGAGKTFFADEIAAVLAAGQRQIIRASVDNFHRPSRKRYALGRLSPQGYYQDAFDYPQLIAHLLAPLGAGGSRRFRTRIFDHRRDVSEVSPVARAQWDAILLLDGVFLQRHELNAHVDHSIYLKVDRPEALRRAAARDGSSTAIDDPLNRRYIDAHGLYFAQCDPEANADVLVLNQPLHDPSILR